MVIWMTDNSDNDINGDDVGDHDDNDDVYDDLSAQGTSCECPESQLSHELPSKDLPSLEQIKEKWSSWQRPKRHQIFVVIDIDLLVGLKMGTKIIHASVLTW